MSEKQKVSLEGVLSMIFEVSIACGMRSPSEQSSIIVRFTIVGCSNYTLWCLSIFDLECSKLAS